MSVLQARLAVVIAAIIWSTGGVAVKLSAQSAPQIAAGRAVFAAVALYALLPRSRGRWSPEVIKTALAYAATCILFVWSNTLTTAGNAIFIQNVAPVWVAIASPMLLSERATRAELLSIPFCLVGVTLVFADDLSTGRTTGNLLALAASFSYAALIMRYRKVSSDEGLAATVCGNVIIVLICGIPALSGAAPTASDIGVIAYLGIVQQAVPAVIFVAAIRRVSALEGALLLLLEPIFSPVWALVLVGESLGPLALIGAALVLVATAGRVVAKDRPGSSTR